ncbi:MAG: acyl-CoA carboxylase biotin carboxyl carrier protein subunit [Planctomycetota bacterium]|jgi:biotin carboxyl carrier protein
MAIVRLQGEGATEPIEVEIARVGADGHEGRQVRIGAQTCEVEIERTGPASGWIRREGRVTPFHVSRDGDRIQVWVRGRTWTFDVARRTAQRAREGADGGGSADLTAPMPGTILKINAAAGAEFAAHDALIVLESMKMELTLSAPQAGRVGEVLCAEGELVEMGEILARLEPLE